MTASSTMFTPITLGPLTLRNRVVKSATYEGMTPGGVPCEALARHHGDLAAGGVGMTTVAYAAVEPDGRTFADQLCLDGRSDAGLASVFERVHAGGARVSVQLAHCGFFSKLRRADGSRPAGPSAGKNLYGAASGLPWARAMTDKEVRATIVAFARAARRVVDLGADAVELHLGHGYLLSQFLSPSTNHRADAWGGDASRRRAFPVAVAEAVVDAVGDRAAVIAKINLEDGFEGGATIDDAIGLCESLRAAGVHAAIGSVGFTSRNAFYLMRGKRPLQAMIAAERSALQRVALRVAGPALVQAYPFEPLFLRELALKLRAHTSLPLGLLGGVNSLAGLQFAADHGFELAVMARALIHDPGFVARLQRGEVTHSPCDACNECVGQMDIDGVRCVRADARGPA